MSPSNLAVLDMLVYYALCLGGISYMSARLRKRKGAGSEQLRAFRGPRFVAMLVMSAAGIAVAVIAMRGDFTAATRSYVGAPYFAAMLYVMTAWFRQMK